MPTKERKIKLELGSSYTITWSDNTTSVFKVIGGDPAMCIIEEQEKEQEMMEFLSRPHQSIEELVK
jgi:hypothetical protein